MGIFRLGDDFLGDRNVKVKVQAMSTMEIDFNPEIHRINGQKRGYGIEINEEIDKNLNEKDKEQARKDLERVKKEKEQAEKHARENPDEVDTEVHEACWQSLVKYNNHFRPSELIYIVVDGVAPKAKSDQQRQRRYKSAKFRSEDAVFDTNAISPGTKYMRRLCAYLERKIKEDQRKREPELTAKKVIFSSDLVPGEGEHKIMEAFRDGTIPLSGNHVIIGVDNDLIPLALALRKENLYFIRGFTKKGDPPAYMTSIEKVRNVFLYELGILYSVDDPKPAIAIPIQRVISDLVLLFALIPNDFLPTMPGFYALPGGLNSAIQAYRTWQRFPKRETTTQQEVVTERSYLTNDDGIVFPALLEYLNILVKEEPMLLRSLRVNENFVPFKALKKATEVSEIKETGRGAGRQNKSVTLDLEKFHDLWWQNFERRGLGDLEIKGFKRVSSSFKEQVCRFYFEGLSWFFSYYMFGPTAINWNWFYPYYWAPTIFDLTSINVLPTTDWQKNEATLTPLLNSLIIFPPSSFGLIPSSVRALIEDGPLADIAPADFELWEEGAFTGKSHGSKPEQVIALLPIVSPQRVMIEFLNIDLPDNLLEKYAPQTDHEYVYGKESTAEKDFRASLAQRGVQSTRGARGRTPRAGGEFKMFASRGRGEGSAPPSERGSRSSRGESRGGRGERGQRGSFRSRGERGRGRGDSRGRGRNPRGSKSPSFVE